MTRYFSVMLRGAILSGARSIAVPALAVLLVAGTAVASPAQEAVGQPPPREPAADVYAEARGLRDAGRLEEAADRLRAHLARNPGDVDARWLLAQTLYWLGRPDAARDEYLRALAERPEDTTLRLDAARFLVEVGRGREAGDVLAPLLADRDRLPSDLAAETARLEREIARLTAPWVAVRPTASRDDQPLTAVGAELEAGWHPAEGVAVAVRASPARLESGPFETDVADLEATLALRRPGWPLEADLSAGVSDRSDPGSTDPIGRAAVALRLPGEARLRGEVRRWRYLWTARSLADPELLVETFEVELDRGDHPGWAGAAGARVDRFPDDNEIHAAWAWIVAPVLVRPAGSLRLGYAFEVQDTEESRFTAGGEYDPYYTPEAFLAHSVVAAFSAPLDPRVTLSVDGAVAFHAREDAPTLDPIAGPPGMGPPRPPPGGRVAFDERDLTPWRARARLDADVSPSWGLRLEAEHRRSAFFEITGATAALTFRFPR